MQIIAMQIIAMQIIAIQSIARDHRYFMFMPDYAEIAKIWRS
jgi:hypothetical protein